MFPRNVNINIFFLTKIRVTETNVHLQYANNFTKKKRGRNK